MRATILNACIRGCEVKTNKKGEPYVLVRYEEDGTGKPCELVDKDESRADGYKRDAMMDLLIDIDQGRNFTNIRIIEARDHSAKKAKGDYWR